MHCPTCETEFQGTRCSCGWTPGAPQGHTQPPAGRRWKRCEWVTPHGTCGAPTGLLSELAELGRLLPPRLCAWHRDRELISLADVKMSERQVFDQWRSAFPAGTTYQPFPGIWDKDPELLWLLVTGAVSFAEMEAQLLRRGGMRTRPAVDGTEESLT